MRTNKSFFDQWQRKIHEDPMRWVDNRHQLAIAAS